MLMPDLAQIKVKSHARKFDGFYKIDELIFDHPTFQEGMIEDVKREIFVRPDAVAVLPYDPETDSVLLIRQLRIASIGKLDDPWVIELIAGLDDNVDEPLASIAARESFEEAGLRLSNFIQIAEFFPSVGGSNEYLTIFLALCDLSDAGGYFGLIEEKEDIEAFVVSRDEAMRMMAFGEIHTATTIIGLQWLALNYKNYAIK